MKKLIVLLTIALALITACMIYIIKRGVSLRLEPVIDPTVMSISEESIAKALLYRLTPQFQPAAYVVIGFDLQNESEKKIVKALLKEFETLFHKHPSVAEGFQSLSRCSQPCWIMTDSKNSNQLAGNGPVETNLRSSGLNYFTLSLMKFRRGDFVPSACETQKRISFDCVTPLAVREWQRKMKTPDKYFFVESYFQQDYFLFLEQ